MEGQSWPWKEGSRVRWRACRVGRRSLLRVSAVGRGVPMVRASWCAVGVASVDFLRSFGVVVVLAVAVTGSVAGSSCNEVGVWGAEAMAAL